MAPRVVSMRFTWETIDGDAWGEWLRRSSLGSVIVSETEVGIDTVRGRQGAGPAAAAQ